MNFAKQIAFLWVLVLFCLCLMCKYCVFAFGKKKIGLLCSQISWCWLWQILCVSVYHIILMLEYNPYDTYWYARECYSTQSSRLHHTSINMGQSIVIINTYRIPPIFSFISRCCCCCSLLLLCRHRCDANKYIYAQPKCRIYFHNRIFH